SWAVQGLMGRVHTDVVVTFLRGTSTTTRKPIRFSFSRNAPPLQESVNRVTGLPLALPVGLQNATSRDITWFPGNLVFNSCEMLER
ncbi:MAG: hypothetical protein OEZ52_16280, partial [Candidatus Aminicenantes bacterium]|nr:hypothetical protein [Candidatus Aminicenantes bacterium]